MTTAPRFSPWRFLQPCSLGLLAAAYATATAHAEVTVPAIFSNSMVLQRDQKVPLWGWADEGEKVTVEFAGQKAVTTAKDGKWSVTLNALRANSKGAKLTVQGKNRIELEDVLVGEVWFCSGQSNMAFTVNASKDAQTEIATANNGRIRHFKVANVTGEKSLAEVKTIGGWKAASKDTVGSFTAVGYYFGREIEKALDVPIGLIGCNWGGTRIEPWIPPVGFQSVPALKEEFADKLDTFPRMAPVMQRIPVPVLDKDGKPVIGKDGKPTTRQVPELDKDGKPVLMASQGSPTAIYNAMVHPIIPYAIRGVLWYQGEANNGEGMIYFEKMKALIGGWRSSWQQGDFPFYFVQLAPFQYKRPESLPALWEAQTATLSVPNTGMAVTTDVGMVSDIHPKDKQTVGHRLALWALAKTYQKPAGPHASPLFDKLKIEGTKARVSFKNADGGLKARDGRALTWFTIAGEDKKFVEARAEISGDSVIVSAPGVEKPVAVRFGWNETAEPNLANGAGLPASPFRTDPWTDATMPTVTVAPDATKK